MLRIPLILLLAALPALPWGFAAHKAGGRVTAGLLGPSAKARVARILGVPNTPDALADALAAASIWPDVEGRRNYPQAAPWHYINLSARYGFRDRPDPLRQPNTAYAKLIEYSGKLAAGKPDELEPGSDLKYLIHIAQDVHQPLHAGGNSDRGGNCLLVNHPSKNLHAAWDYGLLEERVGSDDRALAARLMAALNSWSPARRRTGEAVPSGLPSWFRQWLAESRDLAWKHAYAPLRPRVPKYPPRNVSSCEEVSELYRTTVWQLPPSYRNQAAPVMEERLLVGSVRLAALLNRIWP